MPPPEPRSSTTSPVFSSASAVGLPHPSDASMASAGIAGGLCLVVEIRGNGIRPAAAGRAAAASRLLPAASLKRRLAVFLLHHFLDVHPSRCLLYIRLGECIRPVIDSSRRIYEAIALGRLQRPSTSWRTCSRRWRTRPGCESSRCWATTKSASATSTTVSACHSRLRRVTSPTCVEPGWWPHAATACGCTTRSRSHSTRSSSSVVNAAVDALGTAARHRERPQAVSALVRTALRAGQSGGRRVLRAKDARSEAP